MAWDGYTVNKLDNRNNKQFPLSNLCKKVSPLNTLMGCENKLRVTIHIIRDATFQVFA
jgi:hypothetical protein